MKRFVALLLLLTAIFFVSCESIIELFGFELKKPDPIIEEPQVNVEEETVLIGCSHSLKSIYKIYPDGMVEKISTCDRQKNGVYDFAYDNDNNVLYTVNLDGIFKLDYKSGKTELLISCDSVVICMITYHPDEKAIYGLNDGVNGAIFKIDVSSRKIIKIDDLKDVYKCSFPVNTKEYSIYSLVFIKNRFYAVIYYHSDHFVRLCYFDISTQQIKAIGGLIEQQYDFFDLAYDHINSVLYASVDYKGNPQLVTIDLETGKLNSISPYFFNDFTCLNCLAAVEQIKNTN